MSYRNISVRQLRDWMENDPESIFVVDVRQPFEHDIAHLHGTHLIPLNELGQRLAEIPEDRRVVCLCHHGGRSAHACDVLASQGWKRLYNVDGGIHRWSLEIDDSVPVY